MTRLDVKVQRLAPDAPTPAGTAYRPRGSEADGNAAYERYLLHCSDYLKRQMLVYEHWPQRRYDVLGYRKEKVFTDMNA